MSTEYEDSLDGFELKPNMDLDIPIDDLLDERASKLKKVLGRVKASTKDHISAYDIQELEELLQELQERMGTAGIEKWYVPGGPYSIDKLHKHKAFFDATRDYREVLILGGNRCLLEGTLVATPKGPVAIQDLKVGDEVLDRYGKPTKVTDVWDNGLAPVVHLTNRGKTYVTCTADHGMDAIRIARSDGGYDYPEIEQKVYASKLTSRNLVRRVSVKNPLGPVFEPHAYAIGAMLGDGCCTEGSRNRMIISSKDEKVPHKISLLLGGSSPRKLNSGNYSWAVAGNCNYYQEWMHKRRNHEKLVDLDVIKTWNRKSLVEFVAGLIDTDGCLQKGRDGHCLSFANQNSQIVAAYHYAVLALWMEDASIVTSNSSHYVNGKVQTVLVRNQHKIREILDELRPQLVHQYKAELNEDSFGGKRSHPDRIFLKPIEGLQSKVWDITVEHPEHFFLLANGVSVSNTSKTTSGCYLSAITALGTYPDWWQGVVFDGPVNNWSVGSTSKSVKETLQETLLGPLGAIGTGMIPKEHIIKTVAKSGVPGGIDTVYVRHVPTGGTSTITFMSGEQGTKAFMGAARHIIHIDEPMDEAVYNECLIRTMTTNGRMVHSVTPKLGLTRMLANFLSDCDLLAGTQEIKGLRMAKALIDLEDKKAEEECG